MVIRIYCFHCECGLKYFGKTERKNWEKYNGSGIYWKNHLKKNNHNIIKKHWIGYFINKEICEEFCLWYSKTNDIVNNKNYANLCYENGYDGQSIGFLHNEKTKQKISENHNKYWKGKKHSEETKQKMRKPKSEETKQKMSENKKGKKQKNIKCPHCNKEGGFCVMKRWHFNNCKIK